MNSTMREAPVYSPSSEQHSASTYKSTKSSRSSVLERAREYNRKMEDTRRRSQSLERSQASAHSPARSRSAGRATTHHNTRDRAYASVQKDTRHSHSTADRTQPSTSYSRPQSTPRSYQQPSVQSSRSPQRPAQNEENQEAIIAPELLVEALSGHEDGLLAIAEQLMEYYDRGYDAMGEAIIDAFADVQKLFQHVVEAAHLEGAALEASRHEQSTGQLPATPAHASLDEFVDEDVKEILADAIRQASNLDEESRLRMYEQACHEASSNLPVDSEVRGRLQLSLARAESLSAEKGASILKYAMDDILRREHQNTPVPDTERRAEIVLNRPTGLGQQSNSEALASLSEELKDMLQAPVYQDTLLQSVSDRFFDALIESNRNQKKQSDRLEQNLGKLKGEFLLAQAEWEEKLTQATKRADGLQEKYDRLRDFGRYQNNRADDEGSTMYSSVRSAASHAETVASGVSGLAQQARTIMNSNFNCSGMSDANSAVVLEKEDNSFANMQVRYERRERPRSRSRNSRSFREYSQSPHRVDV